MLHSLVIASSKALHSQFSAVLKGNLSGRFSNLLLVPSFAVALQSAIIQEADGSQLLTV